ncbi:hypothetical protein EYB53_022800, partial [Candidatus Chloroploca sp. M-50]
MTQGFDQLRDELAALDEEWAAATHPRTRARLAAERTAVLAALATQAAAHAAQPGQGHVNQAGQTGGVSFGAGNTFHGAVQVGDLINGDKVTGPVIHGGITSGGATFVAGGNPECVKYLWTRVLVKCGAYVPPASR